MRFRFDYCPSYGEEYACSTFTLRHLVDLLVTAYKYSKSFKGVVTVIDTTHDDECRLKIEFLGGENIKVTDTNGEVASKTFTKKGEVTQYAALLCRSVQYFELITQDSISDRDQQLINPGVRPLNETTDKEPISEFEIWWIQDALKQLGDDHDFFDTNS